MRQSVIRNAINQDSAARTASIYSITNLASYGKWLVTIVCLPWLRGAHKVRLHDAIRVAIPSFVKLLTDEDETIRSATLSVLHELADDGGLVR
jgi:hypothetical protein